MLEGRDEAVVDGAVIDAMLPLKPNKKKGYHCRSHQLMSDVVGAADRRLVVLVVDGLFLIDMLN